MRRISDDGPIKIANLNLDFLPGQDCSRGSHRKGQRELTLDLAPRRFPIASFPGRSESRIIAQQS